MDSGCIRLARPAGDSITNASYIWDGFRLSREGQEYAALGLALDRLSRFFGVRAAFGFMEDRSGRHGRNAAALRRPPGPALQGSVLCGQHLFREVPAAYVNGDFVLLLVLAHEFAHVSQFGAGVDAQFERLGQAGQRLRELHADFLAGFYFAELRRINRDINGAAADAILRDMGDVGLAPTHGRPAERAALADAGYRLGWAGGYTFAGAFEKGADMVLGR